MRLSARQLAARMTRRGLAWGGMVGGTGDAYPLGLIVGQDVASPSDHHLRQVARVFHIAGNLPITHVCVRHARSSVERGAAVEVELAHERLGQGRAHDDVQIARVDDDLVIGDHGLELRDH